MDATRVSVMRCKLELTCQHPRPRAHDKTFNHTMCNIYNQVCLQGVAVNFIRASAKVSECCECFTETGSIVSAARGLGLSARIGELHTWCWAGCSPDELGCPLPYLTWLHKHVQNHVLVFHGNETSTNNTSKVSRMRETHVLVWSIISIGARTIQ